MSYHRGNRRRYNNNYRDDYDEERRRAEAFETPEQKLKTAIIKYGDVDIEQEVPLLVAHIRGLGPSGVNVISEGFRIGVTEQPYKTPYYANVLRALDLKAEVPDAELLGKLVLDDFWRGFQAYLDKLSWREVRLCVQFFAHLTSAQVISASSMLALLQAFTAVLDEFGVSHGRAKNAALCAADGLLRAGAVLKAHSSSEVTELINSIQNYAESVSTNKFIVSSITVLHAELDRPESAEEALDAAIAVLMKLDESYFIESTSSLPQPYSESLSDTASPYFSLPFVLVPPEVIELEGLGEGEDSTAGTPRQEEWPEYRLKLFDNDVTADPTSPIGYVVNSIIADIIDIYEVNRKECARLLLEIPKWLLRGTFKPRPGAPWDDGETPGPSWQLESCVMENILAKLLLLPKPIHRPMYYISLVAELCKLSASTVGPALGKSIRRLYTLLGDGLDVHIAQRFAEWFATHMSNFGFQWVWKEWVSDLSLPSHHPKRNFIRRSLEIEIRLAYHERIMTSLPEPFRAPEVDAIPEQAPGPEFEYEEPLNPHYDTTQSLLSLLRGRSKPEEVLSHLENLKKTMPDTVTNRDGAEVPININCVIRSITTQSLLNIGSRSFSHLLNAIERYLPVLRVLASGSISSTSTASSGPGAGDPEAKSDILVAVAEFWRRNRQMIFIVFDKLMQYQIVDPSDVVTWAFTHSDRISEGKKEERTGGISIAIDAFVWTVIEGSLDKANGRVAIAKRKVTALRKEEDDSRARDIAKGGDVGGVDVDAVGTAAASAEPEKPADSPQLISALKVQSVLIREQKMVLSRTLNEFVNILSESARSPVLRKDGWHNRVNWGDEEWEVWETWGWYRHFCRMYAPYLRNYSTSLSTVAFSKIEGLSDDASKLIKRVWNVTAGDDS